MKLITIGGYVMSEIYSQSRLNTRITRISRMNSRNTNKCLETIDIYIIRILPIIQNINYFFRNVELFHLIQLVMPKKSSRILSFSSNLRYLFYLGASILITFIFLRIYMFLSLLVYNDNPFLYDLYTFYVEF